MSMEDLEAIKNLKSSIQNKIKETDKLISELNSEQVLLKEKQKQLEKQVSEIEKQMQTLPFDISILKIE